MDLSNFNLAFAWVIAHGYFLMFIIMMVEGPVITAASAFAAALGFFDIWIVLFLSIFGDWITDLAFYTLGYWGRKELINKFGKFVGLSEVRLARLEDIARRNQAKAMIITKVSPFIAFPGLMLMGAIKMPIKKFALYTLLIILPYCIFYAGIGYFFGRAYDSIMKYVKDGAFILAAVALLLLGIYMVHKKISAHIANKIKKYENSDLL
jgi:membrane protein DedA with SNARE-associated domain